MPSPDRHRPPLPDVAARTAAFVATHEDFLHGHCVLLAIALVARLGGALLAILDTDLETERVVLVHAVAQRPDGTLVDLKGVRSLDEILADFDTVDPWCTPIDTPALLRLNYGHRRPARAVRRRAEQMADALAAGLCATAHAPHPAPASGSRMLSP